MLRSLIFDFLVPLILFLLVRSTLRGWFNPPGSRRGPQQSSQPPISPGGELKKDPVCGTYVSTAIALRKTVHGQVVYFCSEACRERYKA